MYALKGSSTVRRQQPVSVSPDSSKPARAIVQPPSIHTHQRDEQHIVVGADAVALDAGAKAQSDEHDSQRSNGHGGDARLALPAFGQPHAGRDRRRPFCGSIGRHLVRWEAGGGCWVVNG